MPADVRWCSQCYAPAWEFTPRAPIHHPGTIAGPPRHVVPMSRTKASATTYGVAGRVALTVIIVAITLNLLSEILGGGLPLLPVLLCWGGLAVVMLRQIWKPVPVEDADEPGRIRLGDIWRAGLEEDGDPRPPRTTTMRVWRAVTWGLAGAGILGFAYGSVPVRASVLAVSVVWALVAFLRGFWAR
jgi:hypothetical protein